MTAEITASYIQLATASWVWIGECTCAFFHCTLTLTQNSSGSFINSLPKFRSNDPRFRSQRSSRNNYCAHAYTIAPIATDAALLKELKLEKVSHRTIIIFAFQRKSFEFKKATLLIDKTMGRLMRKVRKIANRRKRSKSDSTGRECANCAALRTKVDGELFLAA